MSRLSLSQRHTSQWEAGQTVIAGAFSKGATSPVTVMQRGEWGRRTLANVANDIPSLDFYSFNKQACNLNRARSSSEMWAVCHMVALLTFGGWDSATHTSSLLGNSDKQLHLQLVCSFPGGPVVKNPPANAGDAGWIPGSGRFHGGGNVNSLQNSCLGNSMDRGAWWAAV